jgi:hypothetical protein
MKALFILLTLSTLALAQDPHDEAKINNDTVLFNFRGTDVRAGDLPGRTLSCRMYFAKRRDMGIGTAFHEEYTSYVHYKPIESLTRITLQIDFAEDWDTATVWAQGENYFFKPLTFDKNGITYTHQYDELKRFDPERSPEPYFKDRAQKALKRKNVSEIFGFQNLTVRWAHIPEAKAPQGAGYSIHIFDRISTPRFYMQVSETGDAVNDEWYPTLYGSLDYLVDNKIMTQLEPSVLKQAKSLLGVPTFGMFGMDWSQDDKILRGAYCYPGAPRQLDNYEKLPLGKKLRNLEASNAK